MLSGQPRGVAPLLGFIPVLLFFGFGFYSMVFVEVYGLVGWLALSAVFISGLVMFNGARGTFATSRLQREVMDKPQ
jgi:hypothetical protein